MCRWEFWGLLAATPFLVLIPICFPIRWSFVALFCPQAGHPAPQTAIWGLPSLLCSAFSLTSLSSETCHTQIPAQTDHIVSLRMCHPWVQRSPHTSQTESSHPRVTIISPRTKDRGGFRDPTVKEEGQCRKASLS